MAIKYIKGSHYMQETEKYGIIEMVCFELTDKYAFLAPITEDGAIDLTQVSVYSNEEGDTPIEYIVK